MLGPKSVTRTIVAIAIVLPVAFSASADDGHSHTRPKISRHDQLKVAVQKICPVSGKPLGSMGAPLKIKIGQEELFLCCEGCTTGKVSRKHWATIHANFASAQGQCPVMKKKLPKNPKWTFINGQIFYVCCPPCIDKIKADPVNWLAKLDELYSKSLKNDRAIKPVSQSRSN